MASTVLLHPIGLDRLTWQFIDTATAGITDAVPLELPGHGAAPMSDGVTLAALADYVCRSVAGRFHLVGASLGGIVAQHVALRHPDRVLSLVLSATSAGVDRPILERRALAVRELGTAGVLADYLARWFTEAALRGAPSAAIDYARQRLLADEPAVIGAYWAAMAQHNVLDELSSIRVPTTAVAGRSDQSAPEEALRAIVDRIPGAQLRVIDGPHMLHLEQPLAFTQALSDHFDRFAQVA